MDEQYIKDCIRAELKKELMPKDELERKMPEAAKTALTDMLPEFKLMFREVIEDYAAGLGLDTKTPQGRAKIFKVFSLMETLQYAVDKVSKGIIVAFILAAIAWAAVRGYPKI